MTLVQNCAEGVLGCNNWHLIHGDHLKVQWWHQMNSLGRGMEEMRSSPGSSWSRALGALQWDKSYEHKVFRLPRTPLVFLFSIYYSVSAQWFELLYIKKNKKHHTGEENLCFFTLNSLHSPSHPPYIGWRIFSSLFGTCLLYRLRVRCCGVEEKNVNTCHLLTFYICIFVFWFLK